MKNREVWDQEQVDTFQRCPHDKENPYSQISNDLIRDESISPNCRWLIIYLLSNKNNWKIKISQIREHVKKHLGRDKLLKIVNEGIEAGYIKREDYTFENLKRCKYYVSESPKFKKCFRHPDFQDVGGKAPGNQDNKERTCSKKENLKKKYVAKETNKERSDSHKISLLQGKNKENFEVMKIYLEQHKVPIRDHILIRWFTKWDVDHINYHIGQMLKSKTTIHNAEAWMEKALSKNYEELENTIQINRKWAEDFKNKNNFNDLQVFRKYCRHSLNQYNIMYNLDQETFKIELENCFKNYRYR